MKTEQICQNEEEKSLEPPKILENKIGQEQCDFISKTETGLIKNEWIDIGNLNQMYKLCYDGSIDERIGENSKCGIYLWSETRNGIEYPCYVGQTINKIESRIRGHLINDEPYLFQWKLRNQKEKFRCYWICYANNIDELNKLETIYIKKFNTFHDNNEFGYNLTLGGDNKVVSESTRKKMSLSHMGRAPTNKGIPCSSETKNKLSTLLRGERNPFYGKKHSEETIKKISKLLSGENHPLYGKNRTDDFKRKISESNKKRIYSDETKERISKSLTGRRLSLETRAKMSLSHKKRNA